MIRSCATAVAAVFLVLLPTHGSFGEVTVAPAAHDSEVVVRGQRFDPRSAQGGMAPAHQTSLFPKTYLQPYYDCLAANPGDWMCTEPAPPTPSPGSVTPGRVEEAVRRIGLPALVTHVQPATRTLVNVDTIVYATPAAFDDTVTLLGETVRIHAVPTTYTWHFGDGTTTTTTDPGAPWPHDTVTHRYQRVDDHVPVSVTVSYSVTYSTNAAPWVPLDSPIDSPGPSTIITVTEAHAVLVAP